MKRVICALPNASRLINGIAFESLGKGAGMLSEEVDDHQAAEFCKIAGYSLWEPPEPASEKNEKPGREARKEKETT